MSQEKQLSLSMIEQANKKTYKRFEIKVGDLTAIVKVAQKINSDDRTEILQKSVELNMMEGFPEEVCLIMSLLEVCTNIDFPEDLKGKLILVEYLKTENYLDKILSMIPIEEMEKLTKHLNDSAEGIQVLFNEGHLDEDSEFMKKMKEKIEKSVEKEK